MIPLPYIIYDAMAFPLKLFVAKFSVISSLKLMGVVVWREGNIIMFPQTVLEVADACSGLRSLMSLLASGCGISGFFSREEKSRHECLSGFVDDTDCHFDEYDSRDWDRFSGAVLWCCCG